MKSGNIWIEFEIATPDIYFLIFTPYDDWTSEINEQTEMVRIILSCVQGFNGHGLNPRSLVFESMVISTWDSV